MFRAFKGQEESLWSWYDLSWVGREVEMDAFDVVGNHQYQRKQEH